MKSSSDKPSVWQLTVGLSVFFGSIGLVISTFAMGIAWAIPGGMDPWRYFVVGMCLTGIIVAVMVPLIAATAD